MSGVPRAAATPHPSKTPNISTDIFTMLRFLQTIYPSLILLIWQINQWENYLPFKDSSYFPQSSRIKSNILNTVDPTTQCAMRHVVFGLCHESLFDKIHKFYCLLQTLFFTLGIRATAASPLNARARDCQKRAFFVSSVTQLIHSFLGSQLKQTKFSTCQTIEQQAMFLKVNFCYFGLES